MAISCEPQIFFIDLVVHDFPKRKLKCLLCYKTTFCHPVNSELILHSILNLSYGDTLNGKRKKKSILLCKLKEGDQLGYLPSTTNEPAIYNILHFKLWETMPQAIS